MYYDNSTLRLYTVLQPINTTGIFYIYVHDIYFNVLANISINASTICISVNNTQFIISADNILYYFKITNNSNNNNNTTTNNITNITITINDNINYNL